MYGRTYQNARITFGGYSITIENEIVKDGILGFLQFQPFIFPRRKLIVEDNGYTIIY